MPLSNAKRLLYAILLIVFHGFMVSTKAAAPEVHAISVAEGLEHPWSLAFLPGGRYLVTERPGRLRVVDEDGTVHPPVAGLPAVAGTGQGGLLDVLLDSDFAANRVLYFCFAEPADHAAGRVEVNGTALASARFSEDGTRLESVRVIFRQRPKVRSRLHFGCRIVEGMKNGHPDGTLFLTLGDRFKFMQDAQTLDNHLGKIVRVGKDGHVPRDNPFVNQPGALPEIWSYGHRNIQGATLGPDGKLWTHEHGPQGGDELNRPESGRNHGWPVITYGEQYGGGPIGAGITHKDGMVQPLHHWTPSIAPSGMTFLTSGRYGPEWRGSLFVGSLKFQYLARLWFDGVWREEPLLTRLGERVRDVRQGPDGALYLLTDSVKGRLLRVVPRTSGLQAK